MKKFQIKAFTLVELIIVITILAILRTIGFMSFQSYTLDARDGKRKTDLGTLRNGLEIYQSKNTSLPNPDNFANILSGTTISYQGYASGTTLKSLRISDDTKDPKDNTYYTYSVNLDKTKYQLLAMLENKENLAYNQNNKFINETYALDYSTRFPYTLGGNFGIYLSGTTQTPVQDYGTGDVNITSNSTQYTIITSNTGINQPKIITFVNPCETTTINIPNTSYQIASCNVGASKAGTGVESYGYFFQWGNNYGFEYGKSYTGTTILYDTTTCTPNNCIYNKFVTSSSNDDWSSIINNKLWGGDCDNLQVQTSECQVKTKGPCPEGFHIPKSLEWSKILTDAGWLSSGKSQNMINMFLIPMTGYRNGALDTDIRYNGDMTHFITTSFYNDGVNDLNIYGENWGYSLSIETTSSSYRNRLQRLPVRCLKNY